MKNKICIIILYFGNLPDTIQVFLKSCQINYQFEWLFFTDAELINTPQNVHVEKCSLSNIKELIENKINMNVALEAPYKLCDFRPAFGLIFEDYLREYDFWGYGDIDLVYGDLSNFITDDLCEKYDKIYPCGHLSLIRNNDECNRAFMHEIPGTLGYKDVFTNSKSYIFDEYRGINEKLKDIGKKIYGNIEFVDMDVAYERFRMADKKTILVVFPKYPFVDKLPTNYNHQVFYHQDEKAYHSFVNKDGNIEKKEVAYIHYRHKIDNKLDCNSVNDYFVTKDGIIAKKGEVTIDIINEMNTFPGKKIENREYLSLCKQQIIYRFGKNKKIRNFVRLLKGKDRI